MFKLAKLVRRDLFKSCLNLEIITGDSCYPWISRTDNSPPRAARNSRQQAISVATDVLRLGSTHYRRRDRSSSIKRRIKIDWCAEKYLDDHSCLVVGLSPSPSLLPSTILTSRHTSAENKVIIVSLASRHCNKSTRTNNTVKVTYYAALLYGSIVSVLPHPLFVVGKPILMSARTLLRFLLHDRLKTDADGVTS